jgi:uncharacterized membrane protein
MDIKCSISNTKCDSSNCHKLDDIAVPIRNLIIKQYPNLKDNSYISFETISKYRRIYLNDLIENEKGEIDVLEKNVIDAISKNKILSANIEDDMNESITFGDKIADKIAVFGGSWTFIIIFFLFILVWMAINIIILTSKPFDPYPFILLNLILSCLAAIQAPIIMMSQNRKEQKDRKRSENDYKINLKAELEIQMLHEKVDHLMIHQNKKLLEIQQIQVDFFEDAIKKINTNYKSE